MKKILTATWRFLKVWFARIALLIVAVCLVLGYFGVPVDQKYLPSLLVLLLVGIYEVVFEIKTTNEKVDIAGVISKLGELKYTVGMLINQLSPKLYALFQCKEEFEAILVNTAFNEKVVIDHLGLDMQQAWDYSRKLLFSPKCRLTNLEFRLLILSDVKNKDWPSEVQDWSENVPQSLRHIGADAKKAAEIMKATNGRMRFEVRKYADVPVVHGWSMKHPAKVWYFAFCRWNESSYDWADGSYIKVDESSRASVPGRLADIYDSYFEHLWATSPQVLKFEVN